MTFRRPAPRARALAALLAGLAALLLSASSTGCAEIGLDEDPADSAVGAAKAAQKMQNKRYERAKEATSLLDAK